MGRPETTADGSRLSGTSQVLDLTRRDVANQYTAGWNLLLDNFAADLVANPLATRAVRPTSLPIRSRPEQFARPRCQSAHDLSSSPVLEARRHRSRRATTACNGSPVGGLRSRCSIAVQ